MPRSHQQLSDLCKSLGLDYHQSGPRKAKEDLTRVLRAHFLKQDYPNGTPYIELVPMLAFPFEKLRPKEQDQLWTSPDWFCQQKFNGVRTILHFVRDVGVFAHSRETSEVTFRRRDLSAYLLFGNYKPTFSAVIDCEATADEGLQRVAALLHQDPVASRRLQGEYFRITFNCFDITNWQGEDLRSLPLRERLTHLTKFSGTVECCSDLKNHFVFPPFVTKGKRQFVERLLGENAEGAIFKYQHSPYRDDGSRSRSAWIKLKKSIQLTGFVSGADVRDGILRALRISVLSEDGFQLIAKIAGLSRDLRKRASLRSPAGGTQLDPSFLGKVVTVEGLELAAKAARLLHPRIVEWRPELKQECCIYRAADLLALKEGRLRSPMRVTGIFHP